MTPFRLSRPTPDPALPFTVVLPVESLTERHRPGTLADVVGQCAAVIQLLSFLDAPSARAFLFAGPTGVGKTTAARALAHDLGVDRDWGYHQIDSARGDAESVDDALRMLRFTCPAGSGWKLVVVDEADLMTPKASHLWLSALENLPPKSVVVFTTNRPEAFPQRFIDRCETIEFRADAALLAQDADALIARIWLAETGRTDAPRAADLPGLVDARGCLSFRRAVAALDPMIRVLGTADGSTRTARGADLTPTEKPASVPVVAPAPIVPRPVPAPSVRPTLSMVAAPVAPAPAAPDPAPKRRRPAKPVPAPKPAPEPTPRPMDPRAITARIRAIQNEYARIGYELLDLDTEMESLEAARRDLRRKRA